MYLDPDVQSLGGATVCEDRDELLRARFALDKLLSFIN
jgi:hypothetical protein